LSLLKKNLPGKKAPDQGKQSNLYQTLRKEIPPIRKQGEPPLKDPSSFSRYRCDLCNSSFSLQELRQCAICGRWADKDCFAPAYYVCNSCNGIIELHKKTD
jgi:hypothetical protein